MAGALDIPDLAKRGAFSFPWAQYEGNKVQGNFDASMGSDGVRTGLSIIVRWQDLMVACQEVLGYSFRDVSVPAAPRLRRVLPWQNPYFTQLYAKEITKVIALSQTGAVVNQFNLPGAGAGQGADPVEAATSYSFAILTVSFWRPPFYVRTDHDVIFGGQPREWNRFVERSWQPSAEAMDQQGNQVLYLPGQNPNLAGKSFRGSASVKVAKNRMRLRWVDVPEACVFQAAYTFDPTPQGLPFVATLSQTATTNPVTGLYLPVYYPLIGSVNVPIGGSMYTFTGTATANSNTLTGCTPGTGAALTAYDEIIGPGIPAGTLASAYNNATNVMTLTQKAYLSSAGATFQVDRQSYRFMGCKVGTLLYDSVELVPKALQLPPALMDIPVWGQNEPISQRQYDVIYNFVFFDPPQGYYTKYRGHNNFPWPGDSMWYTVQTQNNFARGIFDALVNPPRFSTPFPYADFSDLFRVI